MISPFFGGDRNIYDQDLIYEVNPARPSGRAGAAEVSHGGAVVDGEEAKFDNIAYRRGDSVGCEGEAADGDGNFGSGCGGDGMCA
jgi:hypothetical protein